MDAETRFRAIEPFFSTKGIGKGTGLGLSMVHGLAAQLGGALRIDSAVGQGTRIELWLPISGEATDRPAPSSAKANKGGRGTVLLVDDEELVRASTASMLVDLGFEVTEAWSAEHALELVASGLRPDVLVTDQLMPGLNGTDLAVKLRRRMPTLPVLVVPAMPTRTACRPGFPTCPSPSASRTLPPASRWSRAPAPKRVPSASIEQRRVGTRSCVGALPSPHGGFSDAGRASASRGDWGMGVSWQR